MHLAAEGLQFRERQLRLLASMRAVYGHIQCVPMTACNMEPVWHMNSDDTCFIERR